MNDFTNAAEALAAIEQTQQRAYAEQRLPRWYVPGVVALGTTAAIASEVDGTAQIVLTLGAVAGILALVVALSTGLRIKFRPRTWTPKAATLMALWITSLFVVWGVVPLAVGAFTGSAVWQKAIAGAVTALYAAATTRPVENLVLARLAGKVTR
ncbi:Uncharacterised protein [Mycobacterium tuberculosis]|nr:Uncharacterised protein [Mycobacterium tuberculosis]